MAVDVFMGGSGCGHGWQWMWSWVAVDVVMGGSRCTGSHGVSIFVNDWYYLKAGWYISTYGLPKGRLVHMDYLKAGWYIGTYGLPKGRLVHWYIWTT